MSKKDDKDQNVSSEFLNNFVHEIAPGLMMARNVRSMIETSKLSKEDQELLKASEESVEESTQKMDRILEACQWDMGAIDIDSKIVQIGNVLSPLKNEFPSLEIKFEGSAELTFVEVDEAAFLKTIKEVIKNGFFFNKSKNQKVEMHVSEEKNTLKIQIKDNGAGIPAEHFENVFKLLFVVSKSRNASETGAGIGLFLAQKILQKHGGEISISESSQTGTVVEIKLPISKVRA